MKPFHYNVNKTFSQRLARAERINRWLSTAFWLAVIALTVGVCKIFGRWL